MPPDPLRLLIAGETFEDLIFAGLPRLPRPGEELRTDEFRRTHGGGALISAAWARSEGLEVHLLSALPPRVGKTLSDEGISHLNLRRRQEPHAVTACLSFGPERSFATYDGVNAALEERIYHELRRRGPRAGFDAVLLALPPRFCGAWAEFHEAVRQAGQQTAVFWDFGYDEGLPLRDGFREMVESASGVFVNVQEAALYDSGGGALSRAAASGTLIVVKRGAEGAELFGQPETLVPAPIPLRGVRDTTGAGDAFAAGFLAERLRGGSLADQLTAGNVCGARSVQYLGGLPDRPWAPAGEDGGDGAGESGED